jgi:hypothetical protein
VKILFQTDNGNKNSNVYVCLDLKALKLIRLTQGDQTTVISAVGNSAIEVGPEDPAKTSPTDDPNLNTAPSNSGC